MKILVCKTKNDNKLKYFNGRQFVCGKNRAADISARNTDKQINNFIKMLYKHAATTPQAGNIDYFVQEI